MIITGIGDYTGVVKRTFTIAPATFNKENIRVVNGLENESYTYTGQNLCPKDFLLQYGMRNLKEGTDYTVTYKNNKNVAASKDKKAATIVFKGKGNFKGNMEIPFNIVAGDILELTEKDFKVPSVLYKDVKNNYINKLVLRDIYGKTLAQGKDYEVEYRVCDENKHWKEIESDRVELKV